jgi:enoyl-CoA hydratase
MALTGPEVLITSKQDGIFIITLNRPERENRIMPDLMHRLEETWEEFKRDENAVVAILTGNGETFCSGPDLSYLTKEEATRLAPRPPRFYPWEIWKPIIAAINGDAACGGFHMADACDIRIASEKAVFSIQEAQMNFKSTWVGCLPHTLSLGHALELALWGDSRIPAQRMYEMGWLNRVVPREKVMDEAMSWAYRMLELAPVTVRNIKQVIYRGCYMSLVESRELGAALERNLLYMQDSQEAYDAYRENRKPHFTGK